MKLFNNSIQHSSIQQHIFFIKTQELQVSPQLSAFIEKNRCAEYNHVTTLTGVLKKDQTVLSSQVVHCTWCSIDVEYENSAIKKMSSWLQSGRMGIPSHPLIQQKRKTNSNLQLCARWIYLQACNSGSPMRGLPQPQTKTTTRCQTSQKKNRMMYCSLYQIRRQQKLCSPQESLKLNFPRVGSQQ